jgi:glycosyltransferase involved in cell wall biosynthesis
MCRNAQLWRAALVGAIAKLLNRRIKMVLFVHNSADAHKIDWLVTRLTLRLADAVWADSQASIEARFPSFPQVPVSVISFLVHRLPPLPTQPPAPIFAFWGRLSKQKNLQKALELFASLHLKNPQAYFIIVGPDGGEEKVLRKRVKELGLERTVEFTGPIAFSKIRARLSKASFYLQTSDYEGMALSVTEAMQFGLVPIVTPVGEIAHYCDASNAVIVSDHASTIAEVLTLLENPKQFAARREAAMAVWKGKMLYRDSIFEAARAVFRQDYHPN